MISLDVTYRDAQQVFHLLDRWNPHGPPNTQQVQELFQRNPLSAASEFVDGTTLLHKCVENYCDKVDLIRELITAYPEALERTDSMGYLPLHRALKRHREAQVPSVEVIDFLVKNAPNTLHATILDGSLPLHLAADDNTLTSSEIVRYLVEAYPESVRCRDFLGRYPLHRALATKRPATKTIEVLSTACPLLLSMEDDEGLLPVHRALQDALLFKEDHDEDWSRTIEVLIQIYPMSLQSCSREGQRTPLLQACEDNNSLSQVFRIIREWPEQVSIGEYSRIVFGKNLETGKKCMWK